MAADRIHAGTPEGWRNIPLRELCLKTEINDPAKSPHRSFRYVDVSSVSNQLWKITSSTQHTGSTAPSRARKLVRANDVILATVRPTLKRIALVPYHLDGQIVSTAFCVLRADPLQADPHFVYYWLLTDEFIDRMANLQRGASYPAVSDGNVLEQEIAVPPLPEQRAIAAVLSEIQAAMEVQDKIVATLKELKTATMAKLFREGLRGEPLKQTEIGEIPESWEVMPLGNCATIRYGLGQPPERAVDGVPMIRATDIKRGRIVGSGILRVRRDAIPPSRNPFLNAGDIIVVRSGAYTGDAAVITAEWQDAVAGYDLIITPSDALDSAFLGNFVLDEFAQRFFRAQRDRSAQPHINSQQLSALLVPVPSLEEQRGIARIFSGLDDETAIASGRLQALRVLFSSMLHLLMTGRVRVTPEMIALQTAADRAARRPKWSGKVDEKVLEQVVKRIVEAVAPEKIIVFGSAARGEMGPDSDLDLLIVKSGVHRLATAQMIEHSLIGITIPTDIVVATPKDIEVHKDTIGLIYRPALQEGKILYAA